MQILNKYVIKRRALIWWNKLTVGKKREYEFKTYGYGNQFEDNTLVETDIINMYKRWIMHIE